MLAGLIGTIWKPVLPMVTLVVAPAEWVKGTGYGRGLLAIMAILALYLLFRNALRHERHRAQGDTRKDA
jgi:hypothetical protein